MVDENINQQTSSSEVTNPNANQVGENQDDGQEDLAERSKGRGYEERIDGLVAKNDRLERELTELKTKLTTPPPPPAKPAQPNEQRAVEYLKQLGFQRQEDVKTQIQAIEDRMALNNEHMRLQTAFDGADGRPRYDRNKVETFMRDHAVYDPEVAYKALHEAELFDWAVKQSQSKQKQRPYVERGGASGRNAVEDNTITREKLDEWMKTPEGRLKYEQNRGKILDMMTKGEL